MVSVAVAAWREERYVIMTTTAAKKPAKKKVEPKEGEAAKKPAKKKVVNLSKMSTTEKVKLIEQWSRLVKDAEAALQKNEEALAAAKKRVRNLTADHMKAEAALRQLSRSSPFQPTLIDTTDKNLPTMPGPAKAKSEVKEDAKPATAETNGKPKSDIPF